jgi:SAM-dependent methyltransferase
MQAIPEPAMTKLFFPSTSMPAADWWKMLWPDPECVLRKLTLKPHMSVVDLCCGDGHFTQALVNLQQADIFALDMDREMLTLAQARAGNTVQWIEADARNLPTYLPKPVDVVFMANTFHGVPEQTTLARQVFKALKPGGMFIVVNWHVAAPTETKVLGQPRGPRKGLRMTPIEVSKIVEPAGLELNQVTELPPYHYGAIFQRPEV